MFELIFTLSIFCVFVLIYRKNSEAHRLAKLDYINKLKTDVKFREQEFEALENEEIQDKDIIKVINELKGDQ